MKPAKNVIPITRDNSPMTTNLPEPPVEPDFSLAGYTSFLFDTQRFLNSEFVLSSDPAAIGLGVILWAVAWQQIPCGSLPDDDVQLARLAGFGRDVATFRALKEPALHGFVKCSDGRLYHKFLIGIAIDAQAKRNINRANGSLGGRPSKSKENNHSVSENNPPVSENNPPVSKTEPEVTFSKPIEVKISKENRREVNRSSSNSAYAPAPASPAAAVPPLSVDDLQENTPALIELAKLHGISRIPERLEHFKQKCRTKGYKPDNPLETFIQSCLEDWAKLNEKAGLQGAGGGQKGAGHSATEAYWEQARLSAERAKALIFGNQQGDAQ